MEATLTKPTTKTKDLQWIRQSLQSAIELEYSTLPIYLSAMFSLEVQNYTAYNTIRSVAMEEMVHMAIAANILAALGGNPAIKNINVPFPTKGLPGGAEPDLHVTLASFSKNQLQNFMRIETPEFLLHELKLPEKYPTIAVFYNSIKKAIIDNAEDVTAAIKKGGTANQVGDNIGFSTFVYQEGVDPVKMLCDGIDEILEQGEGASANDLITSSEFETEQSHYAKFAALYYGASYQQPKRIKKITKKNEAKFFKGLPIGYPEVVNTLALPKDGYAKILALDPNGATVKTALEAFDTAFSTMLTTLDTVWNGDAPTSWKNLGAAVHGMVDFRVLSCFNIMRTPIPTDIINNLKNTYTDEFDFISKYTDLTKPVFYGPRFLNTNR
jgi:hypothetical protein